MHSLGASPDTSTGERERREAAVLARGVRDCAIEVSAGGENPANVHEVAKRAELVDEDLVRRVDIDAKRRHRTMR